jgi:beta-lactamase regulating signal transducer with metallopeptidase domain
MSLALLFGLVWKSAACAGLTLLALRALRGRSAAELSQAAHLGLLATIAAPFAVLWTPPLPAPAGLSAIAERAAESLTVAPVTGPPAGVAAGAAAGLDLEALAAGLYAAPAALLALALAAGVIRLHRLRRRAHVVTDGAWLTTLAEAQQRCGFRHGAALLVSTELASPVSWGVLRPVVILDAETARRPQDAPGVIAHELAHLARMDWVKLLLGAVATALFWFNPLVWALARRCHDLREQAADDAVLLQAVTPADYAELLLRCARAESRGLSLASAMAPRAGSVRARIARVFDGSRPTAPARPGWTAACAVAAAMAAAPLAVSFAPSPGVARIVVDGPRRSSNVLDEALIAAVDRGEAGAMEQLIAAGANPDAVVDGDGTPLIVAARTGRADLATALLARGAQIDRAVSGDGNPLIGAAAEGRLEMVRLLLDRGADIEASIATDENALIQASMHGHVEVVRLLIARGADVNAQVGPRTSLGMARSRGHRDVARVLIDAGARR